MSDQSLLESVLEVVDSVVVVCKRECKHCFASQLRCIGRRLKLGRQEDAHEFLRLLIDGLQQRNNSVNPSSVPSPSSPTDSASFVSGLFGGKVRSCVRCLVCQNESVIYDPVMDLSLDIFNVSSLEAALTAFTRPEQLSSPAGHGSSGMVHRYRCSRCKKAVPAEKRTQIQQWPAILTCHFKRFAVSGAFGGSGGGKISKFIKYRNRQISAILDFI